MNLSGSPFDFIIAFFAGVLASCTPCVYPLIPASAGYITGNAQGSKLKGFLLSLAYVSGISVIYSSLGVLAALSGTIFGRFSSSPVIHLVVGVIMLLFGLSMLGVLRPYSPAARPPAFKKITYLSSFLFGIFSGLAISPCLTPVLGAILAYLATKSNLLYGWLLLCSFAYGLGLIFMIIGTCGALISGWPKPGKWMLYIKNASAGIIILSGAYFIYSAVIKL